MWETPVGIGGGWWQYERLPVNLQPGSGPAGEKIIWENVGHQF
jgi:hypothetical protein